MTTTDTERVPAQRILSELSEMLRAVSESLLPGEEITMEMKLTDDLELDSLSIANLTGRVQARYGSKASLIPFFASREAGPFEELRVGELVEYLAGVLDEAVPEPGTPARPVTDHRGPEPREDDTGSIPARGRHRPKNDNAGVLAELAPGAVRRLVQLPDGQVEVFTAGSGPALVMMHPINVGAGVFARQFTALAGDYQVTCAHHPGIGETTWDGGITLPALAGLHRDVLAELGAQPPFHVLGASFGGVVAQQFALSYPDECATLTLLGSSYQVGARRRGPRQLSASVRREIPRGRKAGAAPADAADGDGVADASGAAGDGPVPGDGGDLADVLLRCESMDTRIGVKYLGLFADPPSTLARLPEISVPTLVLHGNRDTVVPVKRAHALYGTIARTQLAQIADAGHFLSLTHSDAVHELLVPFLSSGGLSALSGRKLREAAAAGTSVTSPGISLTGTGLPSPPPDPCTIIIGSGRCGSTMLSRLLALEPDTLSASESMGHRMRANLVRDPDAVLTGAEYWALLAQPGREPGSEARLMHRAGWYPAQYSYPDTGRYAGDRSSIPPILVITLPQLTDDPDGLFDRLCELVPEFPPQTALRHHKMLLHLLAGLTGKRRWVERTGASSEFAEPLLNAFDDAKVVYLTRNVTDTARSMSKHPAFLMTAVRDDFHTRYGADPFAPRMAAGGKALPPENEMPEEMRRLLPHNITMESLREVGRDLRRFESMAAHANGCAEQALEDVPPRHLLRIRYEDIQERPVRELTQLGEFIGMADPGGWAARVADQVRPARTA